MTKISGLAMTLTLLQLIGCASFSEIKKSEYTDKTRMFKAELPIGWMKSNY